MDSGKISISEANGVATVSFFHPQSNSMPGTLLRQLAEAIRDVGISPSVDVVILRSEGEKAFCAGASFDELISITTMDEGKKFFSGFANVINAMRKCPKFILARIQNKAVGGGVGLASAADYCFATEQASVKLSELAIGIGPFIVGPVIERKIGLSAMSQMAINATAWMSAQWAKEKGLYHEVFSTTDEMDQAISLLAVRLSNSNPEAMQELKKTFWRGTENWDDLLVDRAGISGRLVLSAFTRDALQKLKGK